MQVTVEKTGPCQAKVRFTVPGPEFHGAVNKALQNAGRNLNMKGFRPGHVPPQVIERQYGKQLRNEAIEHFVRQAFDQAVKENELKVVGFQRVDLDTITILDGADFSHAFDVSLRPDINLGSYTGQKIESQLEQVMDPEIDDALTGLKQQQSRPEPAGEEGVPLDGMCVAKIEWLIEGESILSRDGLRLSPATPTPGTGPEAFAQALTGARDGDVRELAMTVPQEFEREDIRGKSGTTRITVAQAYRMIPPTDEEIRTLFGAADEAELKKIVKEKLAEAKLERENQRIEGLLVDQLIAAHSFEMPSMMLDEQTQARLAQLKTQLQQQGAPASEIEAQTESQRPTARAAAEKGIRALFLMQAIAEKEKLLVTREDMQNEINLIAARNKATPQEVGEYYQKNNLFEQMTIELLERKVRKFLRENAKVTQPS